MNMQRHPLSALFARFDLAGDDLKALAKDIKGQGQLQPITMHDRMVLDGWNRYQACLLAKVKPKTTNLKLNTDPWSFVCSSNMHRRHMSPVERVTVMSEYMAMLATASEAKGEDRSKLTTPTVSQIEKTLDVSHGTAVKAAQVARAADPDVAQALASKSISLERAAEVSQMPAAERKEAIKAPAPAKAKDDRDARIAQLSRLLAEAQAEAGALRTENEALREQYAEQGSMLKDAIAENETLAKAVNPDGRLNVMMDDLKKCREMARVVVSQNKGLQVGNHDLAKRLESALRKIKKLESSKGEDSNLEDEMLETREDESELEAAG